MIRVIKLWLTVPLCIKNHTLLLQVPSKQKAKKSYTFYAYYYFSRNPHDMHPSGVHLFKVCFPENYLTNDIKCHFQSKCYEYIFKKVRRLVSEIL